MVEPTGANAPARQVQEQVPAEHLAEDRGQERLPKGQPPKFVRGELSGWKVSGWGAPAVLELVADKPEVVLGLGVAGTASPGAGADERARKWDPE